MPAKVVIDASALAALLFGEPEAQMVAERLGESALITPTLFSYELANICWKKVPLSEHVAPRLLHLVLEHFFLDGLCYKVVLEDHSRSTEADVPSRHYYE